ncbi:MAG TPA: hypothetical protein ENK57_01235 [Polyangiaceae bacterium]|nr:hypothetical protein [Polyangiaceae bacterium]
MKRGGGVVSALPRWVAVFMAICLLPSLASAEPPPSRPLEAPLLVAPSDVPALPPEYLTDERAGIRFAYHPSARDRVRLLIEEAEPIRAELSELLGQVVLADLDVRVARGSSDFERIVPSGSRRGSAVLAFSQLRLLVMSLRASPSTGRDVKAAFRRGLAHLALDEVVGDHPLPHWFRLGFALHVDGRDSLSRGRALWWASMQRQLIPVVDLDWHLADGEQPDSVAAAEAADYVRFLITGEREGQLPRLLEAVRETERFDEALARAYQSSASALESTWRRDVAKHKGFLPVLLTGTGLWVALGLLAYGRRRLGKRPEAETEEDKRRRRVVVRSVETDKRARRSERSRTPTTELPEPEVPKVSHDGRWHTLH